MAAKSNLASNNRIYRDAAIDVIAAVDVGVLQSLNLL